MANDRDCRGRGSEAHLNVAVECTSVSTSCWREQNQSSSTRGSPPTCSLAARARTTSKAFWLRCAAHRPDRFPRATRRGPRTGGMYDWPKEVDDSPYREMRDEMAQRYLELTAATTQPVAR